MEKLDHKDTFLSVSLRTNQRSKPPIPLITQDLGML